MSFRHAAETNALLVKKSFDFSRHTKKDEKRACNPLPFFHDPGKDEDFLLFLKQCQGLSSFFEIAAQHLGFCKTTIQNMPRFAVLHSWLQSARAATFLLRPTVLCPKTTDKFFSCLCPHYLSACTRSTSPVNTLHPSTRQISGANHVL